MLKLSHCLKNKSEEIIDKKHCACFIREVERSGAQARGLREYICKECKYMRRGTLK